MVGSLGFLETIMELGEGLGSSVRCRRVGPRMEDCYGR